VPAFTAPRPEVTLVQVEVNPVTTGTARTSTYREAFSALVELTRTFAIGRVAAITGDELLLQTDSGYIQVVSDKVVGPAILILPFVGYLFPIISA
jgi:hypothetical protein